MNLSYCDDWSLNKKKPWNLIDYNKARLNHINRIPYSVIAKEDDNIKNVIDIADNNITVYFMNEVVSPYLIYMFRVYDNDRVFLSSAYHTSYDENSNEKLAHTSFGFQEDGNIYMRLSDIKMGTSTLRHLK